MLLEWCFILLSTRLKHWLLSYSKRLSSNSECSHHPCITTLIWSDSLSDHCCSQYIVLNSQLYQVNLVIVRITDSNTCLVGMPVLCVCILCVCRYSLTQAVVSTWWTVPLSFLHSQRGHTSTFTAEQTTNLRQPALLEQD